MKLCCARALALSLLAIGYPNSFASTEAAPLLTDHLARKTRVEPQILSLFPLGAPRGARGSLKVEVRGYGLEGAYAVWSDCDFITAVIKVVEEIKPEEDHGSARNATLSRVALELSLAPDITIGAHFIRIIAPSGVSNGLPFFIYAEPVVSEEDLPRTDLAPAARQLPRLPVVVSGKISREGETDYFAFQGEAGQTLFLEVLGGGKFDPQISLYEPGGSWFDSRALRRLAFNDEPNTASKNLNPALTCRLSRKGPFLAAVGAFLGRGGPDCSYQLRIIPAAERPDPMSTPRLAHDVEGGWQERSFTRTLGANRLRALAARTVDANDEKSVGQGESGISTSVASEAAKEGPPRTIARKVRLAGDPVLVVEHELGEQGNQPMEISVPALIEGVIDRPGDADRFKFRVNDGAQLAFEVETPVKPAPFFTPRLGVFDGTGEEILNNIYGFVQGSGEFIEKVVEPKVVYNFERGGEYVMEIRDLTSRSGGADFRYRILVRPQIPHVGSIEAAFSLGRSLDGSLKKGLEVERLNLAPGEVKKIAVLIEPEEGYDGQIALSFEGLPPGVESFPAAEAEPERPGVLDEGKKTRFRSGSQRVTLVLSAKQDAPVTRLPLQAHLKALPVVNGKVGSALAVQMIPVMVVKAQEPSEP